MKKLFVILLAAMAMISLAACGGEKDLSASGSQGGDNGGTKKEISFKEATVDNWDTMIKDNVGMQFELPDGWQVDSVETGKSFIQVYFVTDYEQTQSNEMSKAFSRTVFEQTQAAATGDVYEFYDIEQKKISFSDIENSSSVDLEAPFNDDTIDVFYNYNIPKQYKLFIMIK